MAILHWTGHETKVFGVKFYKSCSQHSLKTAFYVTMVREWNCVWPLLVFVNWYKLDFVRFRKWNKLSTVTWSQSLALQKKTRCSIKVWEKRVTAPLIYLQSRLHGSHGDHPPANIPDVLQNSNLRQMKLTINHHTHLGLTEVADRAPSRFPPLRWFQCDTRPQKRDFKMPSCFPFFISIPEKLIKNQ